MKRLIVKPIYFLCSIALFYSQSIFASDMMEQEVNHPIGMAQNVIPGIGDTVIHGVLGNLSGAVVEDLDFYRIYAQAGDVITVDIDGGKGGGGTRDVDTIIAIFSDGPDYIMRAYNDDPPYGEPLDEGSTHYYDSMIKNFLVPETGTYFIGVSHYPRHFTDGGVANSSGPSNGDYTLIISGVSGPAVKHVGIDVKPGNNKVSPLNPRAKGVVPVAILSSDDFNAMDVVVDSLTFGHSGDEVSLQKCNKFARDANHDGKKDMVCHFDNQASHFMKGDVEGVLKGELKDGTKIEGRGMLKVVPEKAR